MLERVSPDEKTVMSVVNSTSNWRDLSLVDSMSQSQFGLFKDLSFPQIFVPSNPGFMGSNTCTVARIVRWKLKSTNIATLLVSWELFYGLVKVISILGEKVLIILRFWVIWFRVTSIFAYERHYVYKYMYFTAMFFWIC